MTLYHYVSTDKAGNIKKGMLQGSSIQHIRQRLLAEGQTLLDISTQSSWRSSLAIFGNHVSISALSILTLEFGTLLSAGIPLSAVTREIAEQMDNQYLKTVLVTLHERLLEGQSLYYGMNEFPDVFPEIYRAAVAAGEKSGSLAESFIKLARYLQQHERIKATILHAMIYPVFLTVVSLLIVGYLLEFTIPTITKTFIDSHQTLPFATQLLLSICNGLRSYGMLLIFIIIIMAIAFRYMLKKNHFKHTVHLFLMKIPILKSALISINTAHFIRSFGLLLSAGIPLVEAMNTAVKVITMLPMKIAVTAAINDVAAGISLHQSLFKTGYFSKIIQRMIASGESGGKLDFMLLNAADYEDQRISRWTSALLAIFEPLIILMMGMIVLFIGLAALLPIFQMNEFLAP